MGGNSSVSVCLCLGVGGGRVMGKGEGSRGGAGGEGSFPSFSLLVSFLHLILVFLKPVLSRVQCPGRREKVLDARPGT